MKILRETPKDAQGVSWPRHQVNTIECRKRDLVIRITNWMKDKDEPGYDVECYIGGIYDWHESKSFTMYQFQNEQRCKQLAVAYAQAQVEKLL